MMEEGGIYRKEPDGSETLVGFAVSPSEAAVIVDDDRKKVDYDIGYRWKMPKGVQINEAETDCTA